ncbi:RCC1 domain-containing protein [Streptantibioticus ferralitis]|uniref:Chromosome condensation regulator RCC1 n=1 Tax=Streptantibioticus ferralitis TaxID=236510 RepID=A0ABT5Z0Z7_9ACTN|nr:chromosome condensation regulator RCC1 [Streptantibioticus ferralitis]MDF2257433.1 chromosome condensation regulator RCC1 [Streptantibioticus ferralitis]
MAVLAAVAAAITTTVITAAPASAATTATAVAGGAYHSLVLTSTGSVLGFGQNSNGQLGDGTTTDRHTPVTMSLPSGTTAKAVCAGNSFSLVLTSSGSLLATGWNAYGQLGNGTTTDSTTPVSVSLPSGTTVPAIACGAYHSLALTSSGTVLAWGSNSNGQLGDGTITNRTTPVTVSLPSGTTATAVGAGADFSYAVTSSGSALAWGDDFISQLGDGGTTDQHTPVSVSLPSGTTVKSMAGGDYHGLAVTGTNSAEAWGYNGNGQLGNGTTTDSTTPTAVSLPSGTTATAVSAGSAYSLSLTSAGSVLSWGWNYYGQLGNGTTTDSTTPVTVSLPSGTTATAISAGNYHGLAVTNSGSVLAWGYNTYGQLGNGTTTDSTTPVTVSLP